MIFKRNLLKAALVLLSINFALLPGNANAIEIESILSATDAYLHEKIQIEGTVDRILQGGSETTSFYILRDDLRNELRVRSIAESPVIGVSYQVTGVLSVHANSKRPYLSEISRIPLKELVDQPEGLESAPQPNRQLAEEPAPDQKTPIYEQVVTFAKTQTIPFIGLSLLALAGIGLVVFGLVRQIGAKSTGGKVPDKNGRPISAAAERRAKLAQEKKAAAASKTNKSKDDKFSDSALDIDPDALFDSSTLKIELAPEDAVESPGRFQIMTGEEKGREIGIQGYPTDHGIETTVGREAPDEKDRRFAHIQLKDPTVSRKQAKLIFQDGLYQLTNLGATNPTKINGRDLGLNETIDLTVGDIVILGDIKLRFSDKEEQGEIIS